MSLVGQIAELQNYATYKELAWEGGFEEYLETKAILGYGERTAPGGP